MSTRLDQQNTKYFCRFLPPDPNNNTTTKCHSLMRGIRVVRHCSTQNDFDQEYLTQYHTPSTSSMGHPVASFYWMNTDMVGMH